MKDIEIDYYPNGKDVLLILTGLGGSVKGSQNKYETMANNIISKYDFSVFVAATPQGAWNNAKEHLTNVLDYVDSLMNDINKEYKIYVFAHSAGGTYALWYSYLFTRIKRIVVTNPVLNVNFHWLENGQNNFNGEFTKVIIGDKDQSFKFAGLLKRAKIIETVILENTDHEFKDNLTAFIELPEKYLIKN